MIPCISVEAAAGAAPSSSQLSLLRPGRPAKPPRADGATEGKSCFGAKQHLQGINSLATGSLGAEGEKRLIAADLGCLLQNGIFCLLLLIHNRLLTGCAGWTKGIDHPKRWLFAGFL